MNAPPETLETLRQWVRKAEHDLEAGKRIMAVEEGCPYDTACFHCQQAVEKYIKAMLTLLGIEAQRTRDLERLANQLPVASRISVPVTRLVAMNPYAVELRYADDWREPRREEAVDALKIAEEVRAEIRAKLPPEALVWGSQD